MLGVWSWAAAGSWFCPSVQGREVGWGAGEQGRLQHTAVCVPEGLGLMALQFGLAFGKAVQGVAGFRWLKAFSAYPLDCEFSGRAVFCA